MWSELATSCFKVEDISTQACMILLKLLYAGLVGSHETNETFLSHFQLLARLYVVQDLFFEIFESIEGSHHKL